MNVVVVNGRPQAGKDSFVDMCIEYLDNHSTKLSTVQVVKAIYEFFGWDGEKTPEARKWLSDCKDFLTNNGDLIWKYNNKMIDLWAESFPNSTVFVMSREPEEIQRFVDYLDAITVCVRKKEVDDIPASNHADADVYNYDYECYIDNNGTLEELQWQVIDFCDTFLKKEE